jgi:Zn ribbon nucleic-acid-binding protein
MSATELVVTAQVDVDSERKVFAYGAKVPRQMFALVIFRCPSCGSTGTAGSWCEGHSAPVECVGCSVRVERQPVLVPHADGPSNTEIVEDRVDKALADRIAAERDGGAS